MHGRRRTAIILVALAAIAVLGYYVVWPLFKGDGSFTVSGTVEATQVRLAAQVGGLIDTVLVQEGDNVAKDQIVAEVQPAGAGSRSRERVRSSIDGTVLYRSAEPGEFASPGMPIITVGDLSKLTLTVYVPEDRYGSIRLGDVYSVTVDSSPGQSFTGRVIQIADTASFTPRNTQTTDSRKNTVFAIKLELPADTTALKPGMPADVEFRG